MKNNKMRRKRWYQLDDRRLQAQHVFWVVTGLPSILVFGAVAWVLSGYEPSWTSQGVWRFVQILKPFVPWFAFVAALAALVARMHATVQTEVQIDASSAEARFGMYLRHRDYVVGQVKASNSTLVAQHEVDIYRLYQAIFPRNGFDELHLSCHALDSGRDVFDAIPSYLKSLILHGLVYRERENIDQWLFNGDYLYQGMATTLAWFGIPLPESFKILDSDIGDVYGNGVVDADKLAEFTVEYVSCVRSLMKLSHKEEGSWVQELEIFVYRLRRAEGQVHSDYEENLIPEFCK